MNSKHIIDSNDVRTQTIASIVDHVNNMRAAKYHADLFNIKIEESKLIGSADSCYVEAVKIYETTRTRLHDISSILGSVKTKHGEVAEFLDVAKINADAKIYGTQDWASCDTAAVPRTGPWDYIHNQTKVQSKFGNGTNNSLRMVIEHSDKYNDIGFARCDSSTYTIPKDQHEDIMKLLEAEKLATADINGQTLCSNEAVLRKVDQIESNTGRPFTDVVKPSEFKYDEVQLNKFDNTIDNEEAKLRQINEKKVGEIKKNAEEKKQAAAIESKPSFGEAVKTGVGSAVFSGGLTCCIKAWQKHKEGKKFYKFDKKDWEDIGIASATGGISGTSIYCMTNYLNMSAPIAAGVVSAGVGVVSLVRQYRKGRLNKDQFLDAAECICFQSSAATLGAIIGQALIPIPVIGSLIGSIGANILSSLGLKYFNRSEKKMIYEYQKRLNEIIKEIAAEYKEIVEKVQRKLAEFKNILELCFDEKLNSIEQLAASTKLAEYIGVPSNKIITTSEQGLDYIFS